MDKESTRNDYKNINNCCTNIETLLDLNDRAMEDLKSNTHNIGQEEIITIIREFIRCKNDYQELIEKVNRTKKYIDNSIQINGSISDLSAMLVNAVRYALR